MFLYPRFHSDFHSCASGQLCVPSDRLLLSGRAAAVAAVSVLPGFRRCGSAPRKRHSRADSVPRRSPLAFFLLQLRASEKTTRSERERMRHFWGGRRKRDLAGCFFTAQRACCRAAEMAKDPRFERSHGLPARRKRDACRPPLFSTSAKGSNCSPGDRQRVSPMPPRLFRSTTDFPRERQFSRGRGGGGGRSNKCRSATGEATRCSGAESADARGD